MKTIGLLGGMSWESTVTYYQTVNEGIKKRLGGLHSAKVALVSVAALVIGYSIMGEMVMGNAEIVFYFPSYYSHGDHLFRAVGALLVLPGALYLLRRFRVNFIMWVMKKRAERSGEPAARAAP